MRGLQERTKNLRTPDSGVLHAAAQAAFASDGGKRRKSAHSPESCRGFARFGYGMGVVLLALRALGDDGFWAKAGGGGWANANNWDSAIIADGTDNTAYFGVGLNIPPNTAITLDGARTIGHLLFTDQSGADNWMLSTGSGGPLTLDATFDTPSITVALAAQQVTVNAVLTGTAGLEKLGDGTLVLTANNTYTGQTLVSAGLLRVNGQTGSDGVTVLSPTSGQAAGSLGGTGVIAGPVVVQAGGTLSPGNSLGTLTINNCLTLQAASTTQLEVNAATLAHDTVQGLSSVVYGGTLVVSNLAGTLALGQTFPVFSAGNVNGNFSSIMPNPGPWLRWCFDPANGTLSVVSSASQPRIASITRAGTNFILHVTDGPPAASCFVLASTNVGLAKPNWTRLATNVFDVSGSLVFTNSLSPAVPQRFYQISVPSGP